jgi:hypothetical protein
MRTSREQNSCGRRRSSNVSKMGRRECRRVGERLARGRFLDAPPRPAAEGHSYKTAAATLGSSVHTGAPRYEAHPRQAARHSKSEAFAIALRDRPHLGGPSSSCRPSPIAQNAGNNVPMENADRGNRQSNGGEQRRSNVVSPSMPTSLCQQSTRLRRIAMVWFARDEVPGGRQESADSRARRLPEVRLRVVSGGGQDRE